MMAMRLAHPHHLRQLGCTTGRRLTVVTEQLMCLRDVACVVTLPVEITHIGMGCSREEFTTHTVDATGTAHGPTRRVLTASRSANGTLSKRSRIGCGTTTTRSNQDRPASWHGDAGCPRVTHVLARPSEENIMELRHQVRILSAIINKCCLECTVH